MEVFRRPPTQSLPTGASLFLDVVRLLAALVVCYGHLSQAYFSTGWPDGIPAAVNAVTVFFLLSGFVIRYVTTQPASDRTPQGLRSYGIDRVSRIYSVVIPALLFTFIADSISRAVDPGFYLPSFGHEYTHILLRTGIHLTFTQELWNHDITYLSNSPTWSLGYECFYYLFYGLFFYLRGSRRTIVLGIALFVAGYNIWFLLPIWAAGCLLYECFERARTRPMVVKALTVCVLAAAAPFCVSATLRNGFSRFHAASDAFLVQGRASASAYLMGAIFFVLMLLGLLLSERVAVDSRGRLARAIRFCAEATFPLYLFHFPYLILVKSVTHFAPDAAWAKAAVIVSAFVLSVGLGSLLNRLKFAMRAWLRRRFPGRLAMGLA